jgi:hypothetical protein
VWTIATQSFSEAHFATFPLDLVKPCILAGCPPGGVVLDPFVGSGTTVAMARALGARGIGIDIKPEYLQMAEQTRLAQAMLITSETEALPAAQEPANAEQQMELLA